MNSSHRKARTVFLLNAFLFTLLLLAFLVSVTTVGNGDLLGATVFVVTLLTILILTYRGYKWAKWLLGSTQLFFGIVFIISGFAESQLELKIIGWLLLTLGLVQLWLPGMREFLHAQWQANNPAIIDAGFVDSEPVSKEHALLTSVVIYPPFPALLKRVQAAFVDTVLPLGTLFFLAAIIPGVAGWPIAGKLALVFICLLYEPILTSHSLTIGQRLTGIRVRQYRTPDQSLSFLMASSRFIAKLFFGWLSYLFIHFNAERRTLHDMVAGSVVVKKD